MLTLKGRDTVEGCMGAEVGSPLQEGGSPLQEEGSHIHLWEGEGSPLQEGGSPLQEGPAGGG